MSLRATISSAVDTAFDAVGDLVVEATFNSKTEVAYNFSSGQYTSTDSTLTIPVILIEETRGVESAKEAKSQVIVKTEDTDFSLYSTVVVSGVSYRIDSYQTYPGVTILEVVR